MDTRDSLDKADKILRTRTPRMDPAQLRVFVEKFLARRERFLGMRDNYGSPLYLFDEAALLERAGQFQQAFRTHLPACEFFYAVKSNDHPFMITTLAAHGYGMDVSSGRELRDAVSLGAASIIFSGPGKTDEELALACDHAGQVIILIDSFGEMRRLERIASLKAVRVRAGVRLMIDENGLWRKFGIPLRDLAGFWDEAQRAAYLDLCGLQFHCSWNHDPDRQTAFVRRIGQTLADMDPAFLTQVRFIDIGGGYWPEAGEWIQPQATPEGRLAQCLEAGAAEALAHYCLPVVPITEFARQLAVSIRQYIFAQCDCTVHLEPGRWISHDAMHLTLTVIDKKSDDVVITDGGGNMIGWERFEYDYFPVINLSRPASEEHPCMVLGSLCTPHDVWGYSYFGAGIEPGDLLVIPAQGAYTYGLRQTFIKSLPREIVFNAESDYLWGEGRE